MSGRLCKSNAMCATCLQQACNVHLSDRIFRYVAVLPEMVLFLHIPQLGWLRPACGRILGALLTTGLMCP